MPKATHAVLKRGEGGGGRRQSLQEHLRALLDEHAATPTVAEIMERSAAGPVPKRWSAT